MAVNILKKVKEIKGLTNYGLHKALAAAGISISISGVDAYERRGSERIKLEVLCGLRKISGLSWEAFGKELDSEFLPKKK